MFINVWLIIFVLFQINLIFITSGILIFMFLINWWKIIFVYFCFLYFCRGFSSRWISRWCCWLIDFSPDYLLWWLFCFLWFRYSSLINWCFYYSLLFLWYFLLIGNISLLYLWNTWPFFTFGWRPRSFIYFCFYYFCSFGR